MEDDRAKMTDGSSDPAPPREGLIAGTWKYNDRARHGAIDRPRLPTTWIARHVGMRMIEAHGVLARVPAQIRPKQYGAAWPRFRQEAPPLIEQGSTSFVKERNRVQLGASADELDRMSEAISWPLQFLSSSAAKAADVNLWASQITVEEFEKVDDGKADVPWEALQMIADALNAAREVVR